MLIYGSKAKELDNQSIFDKCPNCGNQNCVDIHVVQKYAHVFWIPFFPIGKTGISNCNHCKQVLKLKEMPESFRNAYNNLKKQAKAPVWMFAGLGLVAVLVTIGIISDQQNDAKNRKLIQSPQSGDVFEIKTEDKQYSLFKVGNVNQDTVYIRAHQYETNKFSGLAELKKKGESGYSEVIIPFTKDELKQMLEKGEIIDIDRN
ncbi:MAG TPA: zinc-ribbon domain-containing protein [Chitinophagaceae bacterium]